MPCNQANQFLIVNFKKNPQFLMMTVAQEGKWMLYSEEKSVIDFSKVPYLSFSSISTEQCLDVSQFLEMFPTNQSPRSSESPSEQKQRNQQQNLTTAFNSRNSRNREEKRPQVPTTKKQAKSPLP